MSGDTPTEAGAGPPFKTRALAVIQRLGVTGGTLALGLATVAVAVGLVVVRDDRSVTPSEGAPYVAAALIFLAGWGVARLLRSATEVRPGNAAGSLVAWALGAAIVVLVLGLVVARFPAIGIVELGLLTCFVLGLLAIGSDRLRLDSRIGAGAATLIFVLVAGGVLSRTRISDEPVRTYSAAGPEQLTAAAKSGETVRLRGRADRRYIEPTVGYIAAAECTRVPIVEVQRSALGFQTALIEVAMAACWDGDDLETLVVQQYADSFRGTAVIEPVLLRSASAFDTVPLYGGAQSERAAPRYRDVPVNADDVVTDPHSVVPNMAGYEHPRPWLLDKDGRVNDDGDASNDTVLARVTPDEKSVSVVAAFSVRYPSIRLFDHDDKPLPRGLEGTPAPSQLWLARVQPTGRELVVATGQLSKRGGTVRLVHFTHDGEQPWVMSEVNEDPLGLR